VGCGGTAHHSAAAHSPKLALERYFAQIEPLRDAVNRLLDGADPVLAAAHGGRLTTRQAVRRMDGLERRFAEYAAEVAAIDPTAPQLRGLHAEYAETYVLEDAYLSALVSGLAQHRLSDLPNTQAAQRAAIIHWRIGLTVLARRNGVTPPADLERAGRGEIAPSPGGS
jgi:hypothetical protein